MAGGEAWLGGGKEAEGRGLPGVGSRPSSSPKQAKASTSLIVSPTSSATALSPYYFRWFGEPGALSPPGLCTGCAPAGCTPDTCVAFLLTFLQTLLKYVPYCDALLNSTHFHLINCRVGSTGDGLFVSRSQLGS